MSGMWEHGGKKREGRDGEMKRRSWEKGLRGLEYDVDMRIG